MISFQRYFSLFFFHHLFFPPLHPPSSLSFQAWFLLGGTSTLLNPLFILLSIGQHRENPGTNNENNKDNRPNNNNNQQRPRNSSDGRYRKTHSHLSTTNKAYKTGESTETLSPAE